MTWRAEAACRDLVTSPETDLFFEPDTDIPSVKGGDRKVAQLKRKWAALAVCDACPVARECLAWAVENREHYGIWGGLEESLVRARVSRLGKTGRRPAAAQGAGLARGPKPGMQTHCPQGHRLTPANTYVHNDTEKRQCRRCMRKRARAQQDALAAAKTHCRRGHPYDEDNTGIDAIGRRVCKTCRTEAGQRRSREIARDRAHRNGEVA